MIVIAHNIRSLHNVGSIFRSADAFGIEKLYLTGFTGVPPRAEIAKTALGSENRVAWEYQPDPCVLIQSLRSQGYSIIGLETGKGAVSIVSFSPPEKIALVLGNEVEGIPEEVRKELEALVEIPMRGLKRSLNVSVAAGMAMFVLSQKM